VTPPKLPPWATPRTCREDGCDVRIILARRAQTRSWLAFEAQDRTPFTPAAVGCWVLVDGLAWRPLDLIDQMQADYSITEGRARDLVSGYPWHRVHTHKHDDPNPTTER